MSLILHDKGYPIKHFLRLLGKVLKATEREIAAGKLTVWSPAPKKMAPKKKIA